MDVENSYQKFYTAIVLLSNFVVEEMKRKEKGSYVKITNVVVIMLLGGLMVNSCTDIRRIRRKNIHDGAITFLIKMVCSKEETLNESKKAQCILCEGAGYFKYKKENAEEMCPICRGTGYCTNWDNMQIKKIKMVMPQPFSMLKEDF